MDGVLPQETRHVYARSGRYAVVVKPQPPCTGKFTEVVQVRDATPSTPRITRVAVAPAPATIGQPVTISVEGSGTCPVTIDYGDGNSESRSITFPGSLRHVYSAADLYTVVVSAADSSCAGSGRATFEVRRYVR